MATVQTMSATVKQVVEELEANGHRGTALVVAVAKAFPFQHRRNERQGIR